MMATLFCVLLILTLTSAWNKEYTVSEIKGLNTKQLFEDWSNEFNREYTQNATTTKYSTWLNNLHIVANHNSKHSSFKLRLNQFADMTIDEFSNYLNQSFQKIKPNTSQTIRNNMKPFHSKDNSRKLLVDAVDWTTKGVVTAVRNQATTTASKSCAKNAGWAFSALGVLECDWAIKTGTLDALSVQQLIECATEASGCNKSNDCKKKKRKKKKKRHHQKKQADDVSDVIKGIEYAVDNEGVCEEIYYRYTGQEGTCKEQTCGTKYDKPSGFKMITKNDENAMIAAVTEGCVSVGISSKSEAFQLYSSGVFTADKCGSCIDHYALIVGYGTDPSDGDYWKVKNSWGRKWGEDGFIRICRNCDKNDGKGQCGILQEGIVPTF